MLKWMPFLALFLFIVLYILPLGSKPLFMPDETRYGEIAREMVATDDWIVPRLDGLRYFEKPIMGHWLNALSLMAFGETEFGVRFPTALFTGLTGFFVFCFARRKRGLITGGLATVIYLSFTQVYIMGTVALLDAILTFFLTGGLFFFFLYSEARSRAGQRGYLFFFGLFCGCAFLTKGFLALAIPVIVAVPYMLLQKRFRDLFLQLPLIPIVSALLVIGPWAFFIHRAEPDFWHYFFWVEHIQRFTGAAAGQHPQPFWFYLPVLLLGAFPWTVFLPLLFIGGNWTRTDRGETQFLWLWLFLPIFFFSLSSGKLATYILPCFAPLAILLGKKIGADFLTMNKWWSRSSFLLALLFFLILGVLFLFPLFTKETIIYALDEQKKLYLLYATLVISSLAMGGACIFQKAKRIPLFVFASCLPLLMSNFLLPQELFRSKAPGDFLSRFEDRVDEKSILVSHDDPLREVCWYFKRNDVSIFVAPGEVRYGTSYVDARDRLIMDHAATPPAGLDEFIQFVEKWNKKNRTVVLVVPEFIYTLYRKLNAIPEPDRLESNGKFVFAEFLP
ncbi:MAG: phospholipid carrier-dependent glycosyltransferase [Proteobacteria bacterium]|nr:phospholipid carrier-dependent glycosyltransferase [Pseudomonadota bacterium]MBU1059315.1 phospholipid carrier-dependent glycosyltransferase [Pseudomonadota bacterium]